MAEYALRLSDAELTRYEMMAARALEHEREHWTAAGVVEGAVVADIGCGPGAVSIAIARQVGITGGLLAFDQSPEAVDMARMVTDRAGVANVTVEAATGDATGVAPGGRRRPGDRRVARPVRHRRRPPGLRPPGWASRDSLVASGLATPDDVARWEAAFARLDGMQDRPTVFVPVFCAIGRRPA